jgi:hypothetical protein
VVDARSTQLITIDGVPPVFDTLTPGPDTQVFGRDQMVGAAYSDPGGSGIDPAKVTIRINGVDFTRSAIINDQSCSVRVDRLPAGPVTVRIALRDRAGNAGLAQWQFRVADRGREEAYILSVMHDADQPVRPGRDVQVTAEFTRRPARLEWYVGNRLVSTAMNQVPGPGFRYRIATGVRPEDAHGPNAVSVRFFDDDDRSQTVSSLKPVTIVAADVPQVFRMVSPQNASKAPRGLVVAGEAPPKSQVRVTVSYSGRMLVVPMKGDMFKGVVVTGNDGRWQTQRIDMNAVLVSVDAYVVKAELLDRRGNAVQRVTCNLKP